MFDAWEEIPGILFLNAVYILTIIPQQKGISNNGKDHIVTISNCCLFDEATTVKHAAY